MGTSAFRGELVGAGGERRMKPDDRASRVEQALGVQVQALDGFLEPAEHFIHYRPQDSLIRLREEGQRDGR